MQRIKEIIFTHGKVGRWSVPIDSGAAAGHGFEFWNEGETIAIEELRIRGKKAEERLPKQSSEMEGFDSKSVKLFVRVGFASGFWAIFWQLARSDSNTNRKTSLDSRLNYEYFLPIPWAFPLFPGSFEHYVFIIVSRVCIASIFSELRSKDHNGQIENVPHTPNIQRSFERLCRQS